MITLTKNGRERERERWRERERERERGEVKTRVLWCFLNILLYGFTIIPKNLTVRFKDLP